MSTALMMAIAAAGMGPDAPPGGEPAVPIDILVPNAGITVSNIETYSTGTVAKNHTVKSGYSTQAGDKIILMFSLARVDPRTATAAYGANGMTEVINVVSTDPIQEQRSYIFQYDVLTDTTADVTITGSGDLNRVGAMVCVLKNAKSGADSGTSTENSIEDPSSHSITTGSTDELMIEHNCVTEDTDQGVTGTTIEGTGQVQDAIIEDIDPGQKPMSCYFSHILGTTAASYTFEWDYGAVYDGRTSVIAAFEPNAGKTTSSTASNSITLPGISTASGDKLVVRVGYETHTSRTLTATYDGTAMTKAIQQEYTGGSGGSGGIPGAAIFYLDITATKVAKDIVVSTSPSGDVEQWAVFATILQKAATGAPEATASTTGNQDPTNTNITTLSDEALVLDVIACREPSTLSITQSGSPEQQVEMDKVEQFDSDTAMGVSRYAVSTAQQVTLGWDEATASPTGAAHVLAAFVAGTTGDPPPAPPAAISVGGTLFNNNLESDVVAGGETIILDIVDPNSPATQWVAAGSTFDNQRQNILNGIDGSGSEANGWDAERSNLPVTNVVRTSNTRVTITLSALSNYDISEDEQLQITVPATALTGAVAVVGVPNITIKFVQQVPTEANYFIDSQNGSDSNNGQTLSNAWKNLTKANGVSFSPGTVIGLVAGSSWSGQRLEPKSSGNASNYIEYVKIGAGNDPVIDGQNAPGSNAIYVNNKHHIRFRDLECKRGGKVASVLGGNNIEFIGCEFHNGSSNGVTFENCGPGANCTSCHSHHNGSGSGAFGDPSAGNTGHAFRYKGDSQGTIDSCEANDCKEDGYQSDITHVGLVTIKNCHFHDNFEDGVDNKGGDVEVIDSQIIHNGSKGFTLHKRSGDTTIRRTLIKDTFKNWGIWMDENGGGGFSNGLGRKNENHLWESNIIINNAKGGIQFTDWGQSLKIYHNTLYNNGVSGSPGVAQIHRKSEHHSALEAKNLEIKNNIVTGANQAAFELSRDKGDCTENNNLFRTNSGTCVKILSSTYNNTDVQDGSYSVSEGASYGANTISTAPSFNNPSNDDFRLQTGSAGIDAGDDTVSTTLDYDSNTFGSPPNMGAHDVNV